MNLVPWRDKRTEGEEQSLSTWQGEMDRLFERFLREPFGMLRSLGNGGEQAWLPAVDVSQTEDDVTVRAEIPGIDPKELDVSITGQQLVIAGQKKESSEKKDRDSYYSEIRFGSFRRVVPLPDGIDPDQVSAQSSNGVLTLTIKKTRPGPVKKIEVRSE